MKKKGKKKILIVEDNLDLFRPLELLLKGSYEIVSATNGKQAVELAASVHPDLILMDIIMPEMDGLEAMRLIRQNPETQGVPILAVTATVSNTIEEECYNMGCDDYICKPFTFDQLLPRIEKLLTPEAA